MAKFRKKPVIVEAEQFFPDNQPWPEGVLPYGSPGVPAWGLDVDAEAQGRDVHVRVLWWIGTLEGGHRVDPGDWIITGVHGEKYPCKPDIFEQTYEAVGP